MLDPLDPLVEVDILYDLVWLLVLGTLQVALTCAAHTGPQGMTRLFTRPDKLCTKNRI